MIDQVAGCEQVILYRKRLERVPFTRRRRLRKKKVSASSGITSTSFWLQRLRRHELSQTSAHRRAYTHLNHTALRLCDLSCPGCGRQISSRNRQMFTPDQHFLTLVKVETPHTVCVKGVTGSKAWSAFFGFPCAKGRTTGQGRPDALRPSAKSKSCSIMILGYVHLSSWVISID
jgi:hypothetical protein